MVSVLLRPSGHCFLCSESCLRSVQKCEATPPGIHLMSIYAAVMSFAGPSHCQQQAME